MLQLKLQYSPDPKEHCLRLRIQDQPLVAPFCIARDADVQMHGIILYILMYWETAGFSH